MDDHFSTHKAYAPAVPYTTRPPSPPPIIIPSCALRMDQDVVVVPNYTNVDPTALTSEDLDIITQAGKPVTASDSQLSWTYEKRREAQPVLDFLYLGPSSVARNKEWLRQKGITMLLAARDSQIAHARLMRVDQVARELGIQAASIDVDGNQDLIRAFPKAIRMINDHVLQVFHEQAATHTEQHGAGKDEVVVDRTRLQRAKVLVFCETGNDRSAAVVVAYLMAVYGMELMQACAFVHHRRFCISLDDGMKNLLLNFQDILKAQRMVHQGQQLDGPSAASQNDNSGLQIQASARRTKRGIEETLNNEGGAQEGLDPFVLDRERYLGRSSFVPFVETTDDQNDSDMV